MLAELGLFAALLLILHLLVSNISAGRRVRRLKRRIGTERTRTSWAEAREALVGMVRDGKLDPRSSTFKQFYQLLTFVMRRPDAYDEISDALTTVLISGPAWKRPVWWNEQREWPEEMKSVLEKMSQGTLSLIIYHSSFLRAVRGLFALIRRAKKLEDKKLQGVEERVIERLPRDESTDRVIQAKKELDRLQVSVA